MWGRRATGYHLWWFTTKRRVHPGSGVVVFEPIELSFQVASIPDQDMVQVFAPDRPDEPFDKRVRKSSQLHPM
jgi:hypothetical protein